MEPLTFKQQIQVYADSQVLVMTHGAALINILFMPKVGDSAVVQHAWTSRCPDVYVFICHQRMLHKGKRPCSQPSHVHRVSFLSHDQSQI